jgi:serine/threonine-protein phosphatase 2A regulatory subunit B'
LKQENLQIFEHCLMPLHRHRFIGFFRQSLVKAITCFISKDEGLIELALLTCIKYWPLVKPSNEVDSLAEMETYLNQIKTVAHLSDICIPFVERVALCASSLHWMVAERALFLMHNPVFINLLRMHPAELVRIVVDAIGQNVQTERVEHLSDAGN